MNYEYKNYKVSLPELINKYKTKLNYRINFEKEINNIIKILTYYDKDKVNEVLARLGEVIKVNRVYIFEFKDNLKIMDNTYEWCKHGTEPQIDMLTNLESKIFPWWMARLKNNQKIIIENVDDIPILGINEKAILKKQDIKSVLVIPLFKDELLGFMGFDDTEKTRDWRYEDIRLLKSVGDLIISYWDKVYKNQTIDNANKDLTETVNSIIDALASLGLERDPYTMDHSIRVAKLSKNIAKKLGYNKAEINIIEKAAKLHDIGKVNIPQSVLFKPGKLSEIEYKMIKEHPKFGYEIVKDIKFNSKIKEIILQHHERLDGSGYPFQLQGSEILDESLIVSVADVFESMTSHRVYRSAIKYKDTLNFINNKKGTEFDSEIVEALIEVIKTEGLNF